MGDPETREPGKEPPNDLGKDCRLQKMHCQHSRGTAVGGTQPPAQPIRKGVQVQKSHTGPRGNCWDRPSQRAERTDHSFAVATALTS